jgi:hypothetical protein
MINDMDSQIRVGIKTLRDPAHRWKSYLFCGNLARVLFSVADPRCLYRIPDPHKRI